MPSITHESLVDLFRECPALAPELLRQAGTDLPAGTTPRVTSAELVDLDPAEYRADVVVRLDAADDQADEAIIVEVQLERDAKKRKSWPLYVAGIHARLDCPATLLVIAINDGVANWCAEPISLDRNRSVINPLVFGPNNLPRITDFDQAREHPELAVLSVAAHGKEEDAAPIAAAALTACETLDTHRATRYIDFIFTSLGEAARNALETFMTAHNYQYQSDFAKKYVAEGREEGRTALCDVLTSLLEQRFGDVPPSAQERIADAEIQDLERWTKQVITAADLTEVFRDE